MVSSRVDGGLGLVGVCDVSAVSDGERWDVWLEATTDNQLALVYMESGTRKVGGVYTLEEDRGRPVQVRV